VGLGTEILFILMLVLGPKQLHTLLGHVARAKAQFEEASRGFNNAEDSFRFASFLKQSL
jgi:Sec-independent protein translocase protein TatA